MTPDFMINATDLIVLNNQSRLYIIREQGLVIFPEAGQCCCLVAIYALSSSQSGTYTLESRRDTNANMNDDDPVLSYTHMI